VFTRYILIKNLKQTKKYMFRKIISNLSFSPALVWQLGSYAKKVRKEEITRRLGLIFIALSLIVQSLIVFQPPESANASNPNDFVTGGIGSSIDNFISSYDSNAKYLKDIANYIGITKNEISSVQIGSWKVDNTISWGLLPHFSYTQGERQHNIVDANNDNVATIYSRPMKLLLNTNATVQGWIGNSSIIGWFGIEQNSGNIITNKLPPTLSTECLVNSNTKTQNNECSVCPNNDIITISNLSCAPSIIKSITATNISRGFLDASSINAVASDQISYTITIENIGSKATTAKLSNNLSDILEYSTLIDSGSGDSGGGILNNSTNEISWSDIILDANSKQTRTFSIQLLDTIPVTARGNSNPVSFDCKITNTFGNSIDINIDCPIQKSVESMITKLPTINIFGNILFAITIIMIGIYFHARAHQIKKEIRLIRKDTSAGTF
jgi:hypothetical protein